jgi:hypothetical protein
MYTPVECHVRIIVAAHSQPFWVWNTLNAWPYTYEEHRYRRVEVKPGDITGEMAEKEKSPGEKKIDPLSV